MKTSAAAKTEPVEPLRGAPSARLHLFLAVLLTLLVCAVSAQARIYAFRSFNEENMPKVGNPFGLTQDSRGLIWLWGSHGVTWYDGVRFHHLDTIHGLPDPYVYTVREHRDGRMLLSTYRGLAAYDLATGRLDTLLRLPRTPVRDAVVHERGLFLATDGGVVFHDGARSFQLPIIDPRSGLDHSAMVQQLALDSVRQVLWAATDRIGLCRIELDDLWDLVELAMPPRDTFDVLIDPSVTPVKEKGVPLPVEFYRISDAEERRKRWHALSRVYLVRPWGSRNDTYGVVYDYHQQRPIVWDSELAYSLQGDSLLPLLQFEEKSLMHEVTVHEDGSIGFARGNGALYLRGGEQYRFNHETGLPVNSVQAYWRDRQGIHWFADHQGNLHRLASPGLDVYNSDRYPLLADLRQAVPLSDKEILLGSSRGLSICDMEGVRAVARFDGLESEFLAAHRDRNGRFLVVTETRVYLIDPVTGEQRALTGTQTPHVGKLNVSRDPEGNLWFVFNEHLFRWDGDRLRRHSDRQIVNPLFVDALGADRVMVGQWAWLMEITDRYMRHYSSNGVFHYPEAGLFSRSPAAPERQVLPLPRGKVRDDFSSMYGARGPDGNYWVGTFASGVIRIDLDQPELDSSLIRVYDSRNLLRRNGVTGLTRGQDNCLLFTLHESILEVLEDTLLVSTPDLPENVILNAFLRDVDNRGISGTSHGLFIHDGDLSAALNRGFGLPESPVNDLFPLPDGRVLVLQPNGIVLLHPGRLIADLEPGGGPFVAEVHVRDERVPADRAVVLAGTNRSFSADLGMTDYLNEDLNRFSWKLEGFDRRYRPYTAQTHVEYTNLPPGEYRLLVKARNGMNVERAMTAPLWIKSSPRFHETGWFILIVFLAGFGLLSMVFFLRLQRVRREQERRLAMETEKLRVANRMAATIAHEFNNPLQIIQSSYDFLTSDYVSEESRKRFLEMIPRAVSRMRALIQRLLMLQDLREIDYAGTDKILDLDPFLTQRGEEEGEDRD